MPRRCAQRICDYGPIDDNSYNSYLEDCSCKARTLLFIQRCILFVLCTNSLVDILVRNESLVGAVHELLQKAFSLELASKDVQFEDEMHRTAKAFHGLFSAFQLEHVTLANILGESPDCNVFLDALLDLVEIMQLGTESESEIMFQKKKPELSGLDGFMSNFALLDCASLRIKDLTKEEFEIFPANLKQESSQFRNAMDTNLEQCFVEVLSQTDSIKRQFQRRHLAPEDAQSILKKYSNDQDQSIHLHQLEQRLGGFIQAARRFIDEIPNCIGIREENMKGIGRHAKPASSAHQQLIHLSELLTNTSTTLRDLQMNAKREDWSSLQALFRDIEMQYAMIKPRSNRA